MSANNERIQKINVLSVRDRERLKRQIEMDKRRLRGDIVVPQFRHIKEGNVDRIAGRYAQFMDKSIQEDPGEIMNRIRRTQAALNRGSPVELNGWQRRKLEKQAQEDREFLKKNMCPKSLFYKKESDQEFKKAVEACKVEHTLRFKAVSERYRQSMRQLDSENPDAANMERLRPE